MLLPQQMPWTPRTQRPGESTMAIVEKVKDLLAHLIGAIDSKGHYGRAVTVRLDPEGRVGPGQISAALTDHVRVEMGPRQCRRLEFSGQLQLQNGTYPISGYGIVDEATNALLEVRLREPVQA